MTITRQSIFYILSFKISLILLAPETEKNLRERSFPKLFKDQQTKISLITNELFGGEIGDRLIKKSKNVSNCVQQGERMMCKFWMIFSLGLFGMISVHDLNSNKLWPWDNLVYVKYWTYSWINLAKHDIPIFYGKSESRLVSDL